MTTKQKPNRNKRKLVRAQITAEQQVKLLALIA
jgi:ribosomal protein S12